MRTGLSRLSHRLNRWVHDAESQPRLTEHAMLTALPEKHDGGPPPMKAPEPRPMPVRRPHDQPWIPTGGLVGRKRRNERKGQ